MIMEEVAVMMVVAMAATAMMVKIFCRVVVETRLAGKPAVGSLLRP